MYFLNKNLKSFHHICISTTQYPVLLSLCKVSNSVLKLSIEKQKEEGGLYTFKL